MPTHQCLRQSKHVPCSRPALVKISSIIWVHIPCAPLLIISILFKHQPNIYGIFDIPQNLSHGLSMTLTRIIHVTRYHAYGLWQMSPRAHHSMHKTTHCIGVWNMRHILPISTVFGDILAESLKWEAKGLLTDLATQLMRNFWSTFCK